jgi:cysteinyl-tRNA synthetase
MDQPTIYLYNTLNRRREVFKPIKPGEVSMYNCGPTVYFNMHIGNLRAYLVVDVLRRMFEYLGYSVEQVMNFTDVGHLTSDADEGEDKMEKAARRDSKDPWEIAQFYINAVRSDFKDMNYLTPKHWVRATDHIKEMIGLIQKMEQNGFTYKTDCAVYFDVTKYPSYTQLQGGQELEDKKVGVRDEVNVDPQKKHPADFALWMKCVGQHECHIMRWDSPWGAGFPGWHIECSAMGTKYLGDHFDIHTGGEDHISVHHTNERAQNYGAFKKEVVNVWLHNLFLMVDGGKMGKSRGNMYELQDVKEKGFEPLDLRYFFLGAQYRTRQNFTWEVMKAAQIARKNLSKAVIELNAQASDQEGIISERYRSQFIEAVADDLNTPKALSVMWALVKDETLSSADRLATVLDFDRVLGLDLKARLKNIRILTQDEEQKIERLVEARDAARGSKDWTRADDIRGELANMGVEIEDTPDGTVWRLT